MKTEQLYNLNGYSINDIIKHIEDNFSSSLDEINRCVAKAKHLYYDGTNLFVADNVKIYYFSSLETNRRDKYKFYKKCYPQMKGKKFYSYDISMYKNNCRLFPEIVKNDPKRKVYIWL